MEILKGRRNIITVIITENQAIFDLTGYTANIVIAIAAGVTPELEKAGIISNPENGEIVFTILPVDLTTARPGSFKYEVNIWKTADHTIVFTPITGNVEIKRALDDDPTD